MISIDSFNVIKNFSKYHIDFVSNLEKDIDFIKYIYNSTSVKEDTFGSVESMFNYFFILDLMKCFSLVSDISNFNSLEAYALIHTMARKNGLEINHYSDHHLIYNDKIISSYKNVYNTIKGTLDLEVDKSEIFRLSTMLSKYDRKKQGAYLSSLYRFAHIIANIDGNISLAEESALKTILELTTIDEVSNENNSPNNKSNNTTNFGNNLEESILKLDLLIGLDTVKTQILSLINFLKIQKARELNGYKVSILSYHVVFTGNPGTGKTTVARILANIYKALGLIQKGHLIECDRSALVGEYLGQTAIKTNKLIDKALDGILFIDEAYSLLNDPQDVFGKEAISTLLKRMEDDRSRLIVIIAGYSSEIYSFLDSNPGLKSRFNRFIDFHDYSPQELLLIFESMCIELDYKLTEDAKSKLIHFFNDAYNNRNSSFGNGRFVRNIFEKSLENHANRITNELNLNSYILTTLTDSDIPN